MNDHRAYAPPAVRNELRDTAADADYCAGAMEEVRHSVEFIKQQRAWFEGASQEVAAAFAAAPQAPIDPVIDGLLEHLPKPGSVWPEADREVWLSLVKGSFKLIYRETAAPPATSPPASA